MLSKDIYNPKEAFVYKWINIHNKKIYIGKHKGNINDGYISSGKSFLIAYNHNPSIFKRHILWYGSDKECLQKEWQFIKEAISEYGYAGLYNKTHWDIVKGWKRTCMCCGEWCDPNNDIWAKEFDKYHFENCKERESNKKITYKSELSLCISDKDKLMVKRYYEHKKIDNITPKGKRELNRLRKLIDNTLYKIPM